MLVETKIASSSTCIFFHPAKQVFVLVHSDDFMRVSDGDGLRWVRCVLGRLFEINPT